MTSSNLIEQAKRGDPTAIATLMNRSLQPQGITAAVERDRTRLRVILESSQIPNRDALVAFVQNGITNLGVSDISTVEVSGKQSGQAEQAWVQEWQLDPDESETGIDLPGPAAVPPPPPPVGLSDAADDEDVIPLNSFDDTDPLADLLAIGGSPEDDDYDPLEGLLNVPEGSPLADLEASLEASLLEDDEDVTAPITSSSNSMGVSGAATHPPDEFDEEFSDAIRAGFSDLEYRPLETAPTEIDADDNLAPEFLAADAARQVRNEIPVDLLIDEPNIPVEDPRADEFLPSDLADGADEDLLDLDSIGSARFPSISQLIAEGNADFLEDPTEDTATDVPPDDLDSDDLGSDNLDSDDLGLESLDDIDLEMGAETEEDHWAEADWMATETTAEPLPTDITPSSDMESEEDIQLTSLDSGDEPLDWEDDRSEPVTQNEWVEVQDKRGESDFAEVEEDPPHGQMVGSPMAIQPLDQDGELKASGAGAQSRGVMGNLVLLFVTGWIAALIGFSLWTELQNPGEPAPTPETSAKPRTA